MIEEDNNKGIVFQIARELPSQQKVSLQFANLRLHAWGVFSNVYRGTLVLSNNKEREIAIKKTWPENGDRNFEIRFLSGIKRKPHKNVIQMLYTFSRNTPTQSGCQTKNSFCESYVFAFLPHTLQSLLKKSRLTEIEMKVYTWQLFEGLRYLQAHMIAHRDIKPVNLLVDPQNGLLVIGDFGNAKVVQRDSFSNAYQVTRFYRPPELLLGAREYYWMVDVWSAGCCVAEMMTGKVLFQGATTREMLKLIVQAIGLPSKRDHDYMKAIYFIDPASDVKFLGLKDVMGEINPDWVIFLSEILRYRPRERLHGPKLLSHRFFDQILTADCALSTGLSVTKIITPDDYRIAIRNDCTGGREFASAELKKQIRFTDNVVAPTATAAHPAHKDTGTIQHVPTPTTATAVHKDVPIPKIPSADNQHTLASPNALLSPTVAGKKSAVPV
uniref:Protein kinase domain-containing protein n=1 Tax=Caenorhabditis japonica TaxID=281687 RepID=A0A8R1HYS0_CAEJA